MAPTGKGSLTLLPNEIIEGIIAFLDRPTLEYLSKVNKRIRALSAPRLFESISVTFCPSHLEFLGLLAISPLAKYVRRLKYQGSYLFYPLVKDPEIFRTDIYTRDNYARDRDEGFWNTPQGVVPYVDVQPEVAKIYEEQQKLLTAETDLSTLTMAISKFPRLERFLFRHKQVYYGYQGCSKGPNPVVRHLHAVYPFDTSIRPHFSTVILALRTAARARPVPALDIVGSGPGSGFEVNNELREATYEVMRSVKDLSIHNLWLFEEISKPIQTPLLTTLRISGLISVDLTSLEALCKENARNLRVLHLNNNWFVTPEDESGSDMRRPPQEYLEYFYRIGRICSLIEARVLAYSRKSGGLERLRDLEGFLLGRINDFQTDR